MGMAGRGPLRRRDLVMDPFAAGEPVTEDFLRWEGSKADTAGELVLEDVVRAMEMLLTVRSRAGAGAGAGVTAGATAGADIIESLASSGNSEVQPCDQAPTSSAWNMGDVS
jgi:hypothetical protein